MTSKMEIITESIDENALSSKRDISHGTGAVVTFLGVVRETEGAEKISGIDYEAFREMAEHQFNLIFAELAQRWPIESVRLVHRVGFVPVNEPSLWVEVTAPHRGEAFQACQYLIDEMKRRVPIWKRPASPK